MLNLTASRVAIESGKDEDIADSIRFFLFLAYIEEKNAVGSAGRQADRERRI